MPQTPTPAQIANDPERFAIVFLRIYDKEKRLVPLRWNKVQRHFHARRTGRDLVLKARQLGMSTYIQGEMYRRTVTGTRTTLTLAHDDSTTGLLRRMADRFWDNCHFGDIRPERKYANASLTTYPEFGSEAIIAKAGSLNVGRGATLTDFHGSEVAFWPDAESILTGAMQGGDPDIVLESTPNGAQGYFYNLCMDALHGIGVWTLHFYPWWWDDTYRIPLADGEVLTYTADEAALVEKQSLTPAQIKWRRYKQAELRDKFAQEYPEDPVTCFLTSGRGFFGDMSAVFTAPQGAQYDPSHRYVAGLDFGQIHDPTAMVIFDLTANAQVDLLHIVKLSWAEQRQRIAAKYRQWHCHIIGVESNSIGSVNIDLLRDDGLRVLPFDTTNASKQKIMGAYYEAMHTGGLRLLDIPVQVHEYNTFVSTQLPSGVWRLAADGDGHDDTVMAGAIGWWAATLSTTVPDGQPAIKSKWLDSDAELTGWAKRY